MTGTALAAGEQFRQFYDLYVSQIPPNTENIRDDEPDRVFDSQGQQGRGDRRSRRRDPRDGATILIGTHDVAGPKSSRTSWRRPNRLRGAQREERCTGGGDHRRRRQARRGHRLHADRRPRTDIRLGGAETTSDEHDAVVELGGLCDRHRSLYDTERLDNQLRGRAGRQGDPGNSVFFASLEDPLVTRNLSFKRDPESSSPTDRWGRAVPN